MKHILFVLLAGLLTAACVSLPGAGQAVPAELQNQVITGQLPNGLKYYILKNAKPEKRAHLRLVVNAGSVQETDSERGLAHLLEHMAFNGTKNFPKQAIVDYAEKIGMQFGDNLNAYTSFNETVYKLDVPTDKPEILATSFAILDDWSHNLTLDQAEINKEKGVVQEEWRLGRNVDGRRRDFSIPLLFNGSAYADRLPIGSMNVVNGATADQLRAFYKRWYQPDNMAIIAVGDFDPKDIEGLIGQHFQYPAPNQPTPRKPVPVAPYSQASLHLFSDPELTYNTLSFHEIEAPADRDLASTQKKSLIDGLLGKILNKRFEDLTKKPGSPLLNGFVDGNFLTRGVWLRSLYVVPADGKFEAAVQEALAEVRRVQLYGFTAAEFARETAGYRSDLEQAYSQRGEIPHENQVEGLQRHFLENRPFPDPTRLYNLRLDLLAKLTLDDLNQAAAKALTFNTPLMLVSAVEKSAQPLPKPDQLEDAIAKALVQTPEKPVEKAAGTLLDKKPVPGKVVRQSSLPGLDAQLWELSNGARVYLKKTNFKTNEILVSALSPGGTNTYEDKDWISADFAVNFFQESGLGGLNQSQLGDFLTGKQVQLSVDMSAVTESINGSASPKDLETLFQLLYLRQQAPRQDQEAYQTTLKQYTEYLRNQAQSPEAAFQEAIQRTLTKDDFRSFRVTPEQLTSSYNLNRSAEIYQAKFGSASDFTYAFVGDFDWTQMQTLVETWLAALPAGQKETVRDRGVRPPAVSVHQEVKKGLEPKALVTMFFTGKSTFNFERILTSEALTEVINLRLRDAIREELGGTYDVSAQVGLTKFPWESYQVSIYFGCDPSRQAELIKAVQGVLDKVAAGQFDDSLIAKFREAKHRALETDRKTNGYWLARFLRYDFYGHDLANLTKMDTLVDQIDHAKIAAMAKEMLNPAVRHEVILLPQGK